MATTARSAQIRNRAWFVLQWGVSLGALTYALWDVDFGTLWRALRGYALWPVCILLFCICLDYGAMALRLKVLLPIASLGTTLRGVLICLGYNNILPAKAGDVIKVAYLARQTSAPLTVVAPAILWERLLDAVFLALMGIASAAQLGMGGSVGFSLGLLGALGFLFWVARHYTAFFHRLYAYIPSPKITQALHTLHNHAVDGITVAYVMRGTLLTLLVWCIYFAVFCIGMTLVAGFDLSILQMLVVFTVLAVGAALPSSPGSLGVYEGAIVLGLSWYGIGQSEALGFALFMHMLYFIPVSIVALCLGGRTLTASSTTTK